MIIFTVTIQAKDKSELANILEEMLDFVETPHSLENVVSISDINKEGRTTYRARWKTKDG